MVSMWLKFQPAVPGKLYSATISGFTRHLDVEPMERHGRKVVEFVVSNFPKDAVSFHQVQGLG